MGAAIALREDFEASDLRRLAKASKDAGQSRRLVALAEIYDGGRRTDAARIGGVGLQVIRDWVLRFNTEGPGGLIDRKAPGKSPKLDDGQRRALVEIVEEGPIPAIHGVVRWRLKDLAQWIWDKFRISLTEPTVSRELKAMGFTKMTARPRHHAQNELALEDFKKTSRRVGEAPPASPGWCRDRALVARRSAHRSEKQDHTALGAPGHPAQDGARPAHQMGLYLRRHLPGQRQSGGLDHALLQ